MEDSSERIAQYYRVCGTLDRRKHPVNTLTSDQVLKLFGKNEALFNKNKLRGLYVKETVIGGAEPLASKQSKRVMIL